MYDCSEQCGWLRETRHIYGHVTKWRHWGMFIHWGKQTLHFPKCYAGQNATSAEFLVVQTPPPPPPRVFIVPPLWRMRLVSRDETHMYTIPYQNDCIGVCLYIGEANFVFPQTLYKLESHQH